ncbi:hypothetical protein ACF1GT_16375, partial [Streptomyces sp. NPDC014636]
YAHPSLTPPSTNPPTLHTNGGLSTRQTTHTHLAPETTMTQPTSRAKHTVSSLRLDQPDDVTTADDAVPAVRAKARRRRTPPRRCLWRP